MTPYTIRNHVKTALFASIGSGDTSFSIVAAAAPFNNPPAPSAGRPGVLTMTDNMAAPTKIEHITYSGISDNGDGTLTLTGVTRGAESTTAQSWTAGALIFQAPSSGLLNLDAPWPASLGGTGLSSLTTGSFIRAASSTAFEQRTPTQVRGDISAAASGAITGSGLTIATARIAGRTTASTGALEEIAIGAGLILSGGVLSFNASAVAITGGTIGGISSLGVNGATTVTGNATLGAGSSDSFGVRMHGVGGTQFVAAGNVSGVPTISAYTAGFAGAATLQLQPHGGALNVGGIVTAPRYDVSGGNSYGSWNTSVGGNAYLGLFSTSNLYGYIGSALALFSGGSATHLAIRGESSVLFGVGSSEFLRLLGNGNLLIGTTSDNGQKLQVNGSALLTGIVETVTGGITTRLQSSSGDSRGYVGTISNHNFGILRQGALVLDFSAGFCALNQEHMTVGGGSSGIGANFRFKDDGATTRWLSGILGGVGQRNWVLYDIPNSAARITVDASTGVVNTNKTVNSEVGFTYDSELDKGNSTASDTVNWPARHRQRIVISQNTTLAFTSPGKPCSLILKVVTHSSSGGTYTITWPASVKWAGGIVPNHRTGNSKTHVFAFYFDGTNYFGSAMLDCA